MTNQTQITTSDPSVAEAFLAAQDTVVSIQIIRADGSVEDVGVVSRTHSSKVKQWGWRMFGLRRANHRIHKANRRTARRQAALAQAASEFQSAPQSASDPQE